MISPNKSLGQHYLIDKYKLTHIADSCVQLSKNIIEVGPGTGQLTKQLLVSNAENVIAIEKDERFLETLNSLEKVKIIHEDILNVDFAKLPDYVFVGNLPYNISALIITKFIKYISKFKHGIFLIQKEVADKISAKCNDRNHGRISCFIQSVATVKKILNVPPGCFFPAPKVNSEVIKISFKEHNLQSLDSLNKVLLQAFANPRKTVQNNLKNIPQAQAILEKHNCNMSMRPNNIPVEAYIEIANKLL